MAWQKTPSWRDGSSSGRRSLARWWPRVPARRSHGGSAASSGERPRLRAVGIGAVDGARGGDVGGAGSTDGDGGMRRLGAVRIDGGGGRRVRAPVAPPIPPPPQKAPGDAPTVDPPP